MLNMAEQRLVWTKSMRYVIHERQNDKSQQLHGRLLLAVIFISWESEAETLVR